MRVIAPHIERTTILHDDAHDLLDAEAHLMSDLYWMGRLILADPGETEAPSIDD